MGINMTNDDQVIVDAMFKIKEAIEKKDWDMVCDAFTSVTGVEIKPPKSRIDNIREQFQQRNTEKPESDFVPDILIPDDYDKMTKKQLLNELKEVGISDDVIKKYNNKKKDEIIHLIRLSVEVERTEEQVVDNVTIVTTPKNESEASRNARLAKRRHKEYRPKVNNKPKNNTDTNRDVGYRDLNDGDISQLKQERS